MVLLYGRINTDFFLFQPAAIIKKIYRWATEVKKKEEELDAPEQQPPDKP